jgi:small subunit ribosomal protein S2
MSCVMGDVEGCPAAQNPEKKMKTVNMRQMLEAGVHFGHQARYWNPQMAPYIYGVRHKIHIINLEETLPRFNNVLKLISRIVAKRGKILFVGTKHAARDIVREEATRCGMPYVNYRWLGGMLTNYKTIRQSIKRLRELEGFVESEEGQTLTKKEMLNLMREKTKLENCLAGIKNMGGLPDALFVIDTGHENIAVKEARRLGIPVIGIVDTNTSPRDIDYMIPGNDDAIRSIRLYCQSIADVIVDARGELELELAREKAEREAKQQEAKAKAEAEKAAKAEKAEKAKVTKKATAKTAEPAVEASAEAEKTEAAPKKRVVKRAAKTESSEDSAK